MGLCIDFIRSKLYIFLLMKPGSRQPRAAICLMQNEHSTPPEQPAAPVIYVEKIDE